MDPAIDRSSPARSQSLRSDTPTQSAGDLEPAEVRAILSELNGTPLPPGSAWDTEAIDRLKAFQNSESLPATGNLDTVTAERLRARFEQVSEARHAAGAVEIRLASPTPAEHRQVEQLAQSALHAVERLASQFAADSPIRAAYVKEAAEYSKSVVAAFSRGEITAGEAAHFASRKG